MTAPPPSIVRRWLKSAPCGLWALTSTLGKTPDFWLELLLEHRKANRKCKKKNEMGIHLREIRALAAMQGVHLRWKFFPKPRPEVCTFVRWFTLGQVYLVCTKDHIMVVSGGLIWDTHRQGCKAFDHPLAFHAVHEYAKVPSVD